MKAFKKSVAILVTLVMVMTTLLISPITANAATPVQLESYKFAVWADPENVLTQDIVNTYNSTSTTDTSDTAIAARKAIVGAIQPFRIATSGNYYLFLPSNADCSALKIWTANGASLTIGTTTITSGETTDIFASLNEGGISQSYTFKLGSSSYNVTVMKSSDVGTVYVNTKSGSLKTIYAAKEDNGSADTSVYENGSVMVIQPDGTVDYMGDMDKFSGRGNGTWTTDGEKNPFNLKLSVSTSLLGMSKAKKWCLLASTGTGSDNTLIKNQMTYDFADYIGIPNQVHCKPVDLYVNHQYLGSYQLAEKVEIKSNRVSITDAFENLEIANSTETDTVTGAVIPANLDGTTILTKDSTGNNSLSTSANTSSNYTNVADHTVGARRYSNLTDPSDYTGGYIYELEISNRWVLEGAGFCAYNRQGWVIKSADYATKNMVDYSYDLLFALGGAVYNGGTVPSTSKTTTCSSLTVANYPTAINKRYHGAKSITNPAPATKYQGMKWSDLLDADSAVKYYWTQEFFKNMDSSTSSTYFFKEHDNEDGTISKLYAGPMWDMDNSLLYNGNSSRWGYSYTSTNGWYTRNARIYRWRSQDSSMDYSSDNYSPLNFYAALATNCADFWSMAEKYWYSKISPAVEILLGNKVDETGKLKSIAYYVDTVKNSAKMDAARFSTTYNESTITTGLTSWVSGRQSWINSQISKSSISSTIVAAIPNQYYTGSEITPEFEIRYNDVNLGSIILEKDVDYTLSYTNNVDVTLGSSSATATITGINAYTGTRNVSFKIDPNPLDEATLTIENEAYYDTQLNATLLDANGNDLTDKVSYQWYRGDDAIAGPTDSTYVTTQADEGASIKVVATGDGTNITGSATSNICSIFVGPRPVGYTRTIASWDYDYTLDSSALVNADATGESFYYTATGGENQSTSNLYASVDATTNAKIKWSGSSDFYTNDSCSLSSDQSPVMGTSQTNLIAWGQYPYFETVVSTAGYERIAFSAKLGATKKGPSTWKLQYSLDGVNYTDIENSTYVITANKTMQLAFDDVSLPAACDNQLAVYIRMVVCENLAINGNTIVNQVNGDASVNNIKVTGSSLSIVTSLYAPTITPESDSVVFSDNYIAIDDNNGGADVYYKTNYNNSGDSEPALYTGEFSPFDPKTAKIGDTATITAYSSFDTITSDPVSVTVTFAGVDINSFIYDDYSSDVTSGAVQSTGGVYGKSGKMTAYTDGNSQFVPLWRSDNGSFCVSPDDGAKWSALSGFTYKVSTAGYENVSFSCMAYTTLQGPNSITLQYSTDNINYYNVQSNVELSANKSLEQVFLITDLPAACDNQAVVYIRLATTENLTNSGTALHNNESKGNLYVNNVVIAGEDNGDFKMPYTEKSTSYFGANGKIEYISPDGLPMQYAVFNSNNEVVLSGSYPEGGIQLSTASDFDSNAQDPYRIIIQAFDDEDTSIANSGEYYYKGETVVKFNYNDTTKLFDDYVSTDNLSVRNTSNTENTGTISMYPNGVDPITLSYDKNYGVKVTKTVANPYTASKNLDNHKNNGFWLIEASTIGYTNLTLNLDQLSSSKGPRDWGVAYSLNGTTFTYVANSNARVIEGDAVETYGNLPLPSECDDQEKIYIKIFINGGESLNGTELELLTEDPKGNTGINTVEINGIPIPTYADVTINTTLLENSGDVTGNINIADVNVYVNGALAATTNSNGIATVSLLEGKTSDVELRGNGIATRTISINPDSVTDTQNIPLMAYDVNNDDYVNAKDYAIMNKNSMYNSYKEFFENFINVRTSEYTY